MKKGWKRLILVAGCLLLGCLLGYFVTVTQAGEQNDPAYLAFFAERGLPVPEPAEPENNIIGAGLLLGGDPHGADALSAYRGQVEDPCGTKAPAGDHCVSHLHPARCAWGGPVPRCADGPAVLEKVSAGADRTVRAEWVTTEGV